MEQLGPLISFGLVLTAGLVGGELVARVKMPRVTGWILTGIALRALDIDVLSEARMEDFQPFFQLVLGYIAFTVGSHLHLRSLTNAGRRLFLLVLTEATITPMIVIAAMCGIGGLSTDYGLLFAAIAAAGAPGTTVLVVREARARGVFVKTLIASVALIDMVAVCLFATIDQELSLQHGLNAAFFINALPAVGRVLGIAVAVGFGCAAVAIFLTRAVVGPQLLGASLVAAILLAWGAAEWLGVSSILAVTFLGVALANLIPDKERAGEAYLNTFGSVLFTAFYTLAGMRLSFSQVVPMAGLVALFFLSRAVGKSLSAFTAMRLAKAPVGIQRYLGLALVPHGGVAVGLILIIQNHPYLAAYADTVLSVGLAALAINQLVGPSLARWSLERVGEVGLDRPRLLDFLREQDILVDLDAERPEDAIRRLVDHLYRTHDVELPKAEFMAEVLENYSIENTYLGDGLMVPHTHVEAGTGMAGVMGISSKGFDWGMPDEHRVHAIVLLATPDILKDTHLEVLGAFAAAITSDRNIQEQLYHADTAAHAYDILHAKDATDFNYFLEDLFENEA